MNDLLRKLLRIAAGVVGGFVVSRGCFPLLRALFEKLLPLCPPNRFETRCGLAPALQVFAAEAVALLVWIATGYLVFHLLHRNHTKV